MKKKRVYKYKQGGPIKQGEPQHSWNTGNETPLMLQKPELYNTTAQRAKEKYNPEGYTTGLSELGYSIGKKSAGSYGPYLVNNLPRLFGEERLDEEHKSALAVYFGLPQEKEIFTKSSYKPTRSSKNNNEYYSFNDKTWTNAIDDFIKNEKTKVKRTQAPLGQFTLEKGKDTKGNYVSYYDKWDLHPGFLKGKEVSDVYPAGKPFEVYDRIYYDPKTGKRIEKKKYGGQINNNMRKYKGGGPTPKKKTKEELKAEALNADYFRKSSGYAGESLFDLSPAELALYTMPVGRVVKGAYDLAKPFAAKYITEEAMSKAGIKAYDWINSIGKKTPKKTSQTHTLSTDGTKRAVKASLENENVTDLYPGYAPGSQGTMGASPLKAAQEMPMYNKKFDIYGMFDDNNFPYTPPMNKYGGRVPKYSTGGQVLAALPGALTLGAGIALTATGAGAGVGVPMMVSGTTSGIKGVMDYNTQQDALTQQEAMQKEQQDQLAAYNSAMNPVAPTTPARDPYGVQYGKYGGQVSPQYLAEGGEVVDGQGASTFAPNSGVGQNGRIYGDSHEAPSGGVPMAGGERIFTKSLKASKRWQS